MTYITEINNKNEILTEKQAKWPKIIRKIICLYKIKMKKINIKEIENNDVVYVVNKSEEKIIEYLKEKNIHKVCLSNELNENENFKYYLIQNNVKILDGRWLYKYLAIDILEYILNEQNKKIETIEIAILVNDTEDSLVDVLIALAKKAKAIHVITNEKNKFTNIAEKLFNEYGIIINISNNYRKSLLKIEYILNFNFSNEEINMYEISNSAIIINFKEKINVNSKRFEGININSYQIFMPDNYVKYIKFFHNFDQTILYESFIYRKDSYENIMKKIKEDEVKICALVGNNGNIKKCEYNRVNKI